MGGEQERGRVVGGGVAGGREEERVRMGGGGEVSFYLGGKVEEEDLLSKFYGKSDLSEDE